MRNVEFGALLHDVGKIAVPKEIINKPGPLDDDEWAIMRRHTIEGQKLLDQIGGFMKDVGVIVRASHERFDGCGYPDGLAGGRGDPARGADRVLLRRVQRDDDRPLVPQGPPRARGPRRAARLLRHAVRPRPS